MDRPGILAQIVESMAQDRGMVFPVSVRPQGEYGCRDVCLALPCIVNSCGVRQILELDLSAGEKDQLSVCARSMAGQIDSLKGMPAR